MVSEESEKTREALFLFVSNFVLSPPMFRPLLAALATTTAALHAAPVFQPIQGFENPLARPVGAMAFDPEGNLYGFATVGGTHGDGGFFRMAPGGPVKAFADPWWSSYGDLFRSGPTGGLVRAADGNFYGIIPQGGFAAWGLIARLSPTGELTSVVDFYGTGAQFPSGTLVPGQDGSLYGVAQTSDGRASVLYRLTLAGDFTTIRLAGGIARDFLVAAPAGGFYAHGYDPYSNGTKIVHLAQDGTITPVGTIPWETGSPYPSYIYTISPLVPGPDGALYGIARTSGYRGSVALVFRLALDGTFTPLQFLGGWYGDIDPLQPLTRGADGLLYGITSKVIFRLNSSGQFIALRQLNQADGLTPSGPLALAPDGSLHGTLVDAGTSNTFFRLTPDLAFQTLGSLAETPITAPRTGLVQDGAGNFYGTTTAGGKHGSGILYRISTAGVITPVRDREQGVSGSLATGRDGNVYGLEDRHSPYGDVVDFGQFHRITPDGTFTVLNDYSSSGIAACWNLVPTRDGDFRTLAWDSFEAGAQARILRFSPSRRMTPGRTSSGPVITDTGTLGLMPDGSFISVLANPGRPLRLCQGSSATGMAIGPDLTLPGGAYLYPPSTGAGAPPPPPVIAPDGTLYGLGTDLPSSYRTILYKIPPGGTPTILVDRFQEPYTQRFFTPSCLTLAKNGCLYGTSQAGGRAFSGSVFQITPSGTLSIIHQFDAYDDAGGAYPSPALLSAADGHLYGTTTAGGSTPDGKRTGGGEFYRIWLGAPSQADDPTAITWNAATLHGTVEPGAHPTTVSFQYGIDPDLKRPLTVKAGTIPAGQGSAEVTAPVTRLLPGRTYYVRLITLNAENPVPQASEIHTFTTPKRPTLRELLGLGG